MPFATTSRTRRALALALLLVSPTLSWADELDSVMYRDPEIPVSRAVKTYPAGLAELWLAALDRPERDMRSQAALAIAQAHEGVMPGLAATAPALLRLLEKPDEHPAVLAAAGRALAALDARDAAPAFLRLAKADHPDLRDVIEPALARWDHKPARDLWLERLTQPPPHRHSLVLAIRCLGIVRDERAAPRLRELALSPDVVPPVRLAAAGALGEIRTSGSEPDAAKLAADASPRGMTARLVAATLLRRHEGAEAVKLLQSLAKDTEPAVAVAALTRLSELDTKHVLPVLAAVIASEGAEVRAHGVAAMIRNPSDDHVRLLARTLSDAHPDVRLAARRGLRQLAAHRRALVIEEASSVLGASDWRGQEQAAIFLAQLDHKPASERLVALLTSNRGEVAAAVAWALRQLAVPETLPAILKHVQRRHAELLKLDPKVVVGGIPRDALDRQLSQLAQFVGQARYQPADAALRALVPRILRAGMPPLFTPVGPETRAAAAWALGRLHEGKPEAALVRLIEERLTGDGPAGRDDPRVRRTAAVALGRMQAKQSLEVLRQYSQGTGPTLDVVTHTCRWSVGHMTGEPVPPAGVVEFAQRDWFLVPLK